MKRKSIFTVIMSVILISCLSLGCFAVDSGVAAENTAVSNLDAVVEAAIGELVGAPEGAAVEVEVDGILADADVNRDGEATAGEVSQSLAKYIFVNYDEVDAISSRIAEESGYKVVVLDNGKSTVYIAINIEQNPELMNLSVFRETVKKVCDKQNAYVSDDGISYDLLTYQKIAGELALHAVIYAMTVTMGQNKAGNSLYDSSKIADLNIDESRFPAAGIDFIGSIIMDIIFMTFYNIYQLFTK